MERILYIGMPGSGKTTTLLDILEKELTFRKPDEVAFVSFTKKTIHEAQERIMHRFGLHKKEMPYFRTLHSLAFSACGLSKHDVVSEDHLEMLSIQLGIDLYSQYKSYNQLDLYNLARIKNWTLYNTWGKTFLMHSKPFHEIYHIVQAYEKFKKQYDLFDFTDMIIEYNRTGLPLPVKTAFIDEAQDLSAQQWDMIEKAFQNVETLIVAGDDDQCIYSWSGADRKRFLTFDGERRILDKSHRCPLPIAQFANKISKKINKKQRYKKELTGADHEGTIQSLSKISSANLKNGEDWLILMRNRNVLYGIKQILMDMAVPFAVDHIPFCASKHLVAIEAYKQLYSGDTISGEQAAYLAEYCGENKKLFNLDQQYTKEQILGDIVLNGDFRTQLSKISYRRLAYYDAMINNNESLLSKPKVHVTTIHGAKGAECDNVILSTNQSKLTYKSAMIYPDNEHRVFYVGATRAKKNLFILQATKKRHYNVPKY